jgi:hypothetical protein
MPFYVLFFLTLWKVICWIKCKLGFPDNWSSYIVNVILLLKGFYSILCADGCPFPWRQRTMELPQLGFLSCPHGSSWTQPGKYMKGSGPESNFGALGKWSPCLSALKRAGSKLSNLSLLGPQHLFETPLPWAHSSIKTDPIHIEKERKRKW